MFLKVLAPTLDHCLLYTTLALSWRAFLFLLKFGNSDGDVTGGGGAGWGGGKAIS